MIGLRSLATIGTGARSCQSGRPSPNRAVSRRAPCLLAALAVVLSAGPSRAQTVEEAARSNVGLSVRLCMDVMLRQIPPQQLFGTAGFAYEGIDRGINTYGVALGVDHYYLAPADTAKAQVNDPTGGNGICQVLTTKLTQADVQTLVVEIVQQTYPQAQLERGPDYMAVRNLSQLPLILNISTITRHRYEAAGTIQVSMSFPG